MNAVTDDEMTEYLLVLLRIYRQASKHMIRAAELEEKAKHVTGRGAAGRTASLLKAASAQTDRAVGRLMSMYGAAPASMVDSFIEHMLVASDED